MTNDPPSRTRRGTLNDEARRNDEHRIAMCDLDLLISDPHLSFDINSTFIIWVLAFSPDGATGTLLCVEAEDGS